MQALWKKIADLTITKRLKLPSGQVVDNNRAVSITAAAVVLTADQHGEKPVILNLAAGIAVTLPASTGSGVSFNLIIGTTFTGAATIKVANSTDVMAGQVLQSADGGNTVVVYDTAASDDTITLDGSTKGGLIGDRYELCDVRAGFWALRATQTATGVEASPLSATV